MILGYLNENYMILRLEISALTLYVQTNYTK